MLTCKKQQLLHDKRGMSQSADAECANAMGKEPDSEEEGQESDYPEEEESGNSEGESSSDTEGCEGTAKRVDSIGR